MGIGGLLKGVVDDELENVIVDVGDDKTLPDILGEACQCLDTVPREGFLGSHDDDAVLGMKFIRGPSIEEKIRSEL